MPWLFELKLQSKDDAKSQLEGLRDIKELQHSLQAQALRVATLESKLKDKEAQLVAALNPPHAKKKQCSDAIVQVDYLAVAECKKLYLYDYSSNRMFH